MVIVISYQSERDRTSVSAAVKDRFAGINPTSRIRSGF
jgi:hypothetical protein